MVKKILRKSRFSSISKTKKLKVNDADIKFAFALCTIISDPACMDIWLPSV